jgi:hypothetical protein
LPDPSASINLNRASACLAVLRARPRWARPRTTLRPTT